MKATVNGETTLVEGVQEQWQRARGVLGKGAAAIDSLDALFIAELQEIYSSETQLGPLLMSLADIVEHPVVERHFRGYALELDSRWEDLGRVLGSYGVNPREHPDQAMHALISETRKMAQVCGGAVRDAALVASVQRILHYKIAGYGTIASYAKTLGHIEDAARFAEYAEREEAIDAELSDLALASLNPQASVHPQGGAYEGNSEARTH
jgi:ferritin-like metal-binding protein YciE